MATAKKLPSGSWRCQVYSHTEPVTDAAGKPVIDPKTNLQKQRRVYQSFTCDIPGAKGKRECERMAAAWAAEKENATSVQNITFGEALDRYIRSRESVLSPRTVTDYKRIRRQELQSLMSLKVALITQDDIQTAINFEAKRHSPKTVRNAHSLLSAVMRANRPNFALNTTLPQKKRTTLYIPTDEDIKKLLATAADTDLELPILLAAFGPMRRGEISALTTDNISGNIVHVCQNMVRTSDGQWIIKSPKSYAGDRYIDYPKYVADKWSGMNGPITTLNPNNITDRFKGLLRRAGLPHFRFHDLRHYSASIQHALGIPDSYIMQRGGWTSDSTLKNVYRHTLSDQTKQMNLIANNHFDTLCNTESNTQIKKA